MKCLNRLAEYLFYLFFASLIFSNTLAQAVAIILIFLWIMKCILGRKFIRSPLDIPVIIYLSIRAISCFTSVDVMVSLTELRSGIFFSLIYFAVTNLNDFDKKDKVLYRYIAILIYAGAIASLYGISYVLINHFTTKAQSTAGGITRFAEYTMIIFCLSFSLAQNKQIFPKKFISFLVLGITATGLIFAQERAQWLGVIPVIVVIGMKRERWAVIYLTALFGFIIAIFRTVRNRLVTLIHPLQHTTGRLTIWTSAKSLFLKRPLLGFGPRTYSIVSPFLRDKGTWHSDYLQVYMDSGIFGFASYMYLSLMLFKNCIKICRSHLLKDIGIAFLFTLIAMYIASFFSGHTQEPVITPLFFSLIGFISVLSKQKQ
ncbi:MAG: O-antigen ligase family protein [Candidatus Cloacimonadota bacterium]|nr:MAG: O-antigen ligase family protein [Candidatus Cloacimonadota bacterium]